MRSIDLVRPVVRLRTAPSCEPPYDDELASAIWAPVRQPPLGWAARRGTGGPGGDPAGGTETSGDAHLAVRRFVSTCVEVLNGYRPAGHLRRLAHARESAGVVAQGLAGARRVAALRREVDRRTGRRQRRPGPVGVLRLRLCEPRPGAVEATVLLVTGERTWAMALRMELHDQTWGATVLRLI
jgi:hypothetical protein